MTDNNPGGATKASDPLTFARNELQANIDIYTGPQVPPGNRGDNYEALKTDPTKLNKYIYSEVKFKEVLGRDGSFIEERKLAGPNPPLKRDYYKDSSLNFY